MSLSSNICDSDNIYGISIHPALLIKVKAMLHGSGVSLDEAAPGPTGIGCPQGRGMIDFFEVP